MTQIGMFETPVWERPPHERVREAYGKPREGIDAWFGWGGFETAADGVRSLMALGDVVEAEVLVGPERYERLRWRLGALFAGKPGKPVQKETT